MTMSMQKDKISPPTETPKSSNSKQSANMKFSVIHPHIFIKSFDRKLSSKKSECQNSNLCFFFFFENLI